MEEGDSPRPKSGERLTATGKDLYVVQAETIGEIPTGVVPPRIKEEPEESFLDAKAMAETVLGFGDHKVTEDDKGLDSLVEVKGELPNMEALNMEMQCQRFRQFCYREVDGPRKAFCQLRKLCRQWLDPEKYTKERILELVILEQFLMILPLEMQCWIRERGPESGSQAVALAEDFLWRPQGAERVEEKIPEDLNDFYADSPKSELDPSDIVKIELPMDGDGSPKSELDPSDIVRIEVLMDGDGSPKSGLDPSDIVKIELPMNGDGSPKPELDPSNIVKIELPMDGDGCHIQPPYILGKAAGLEERMYGSLWEKASCDLLLKNQKMPLKDKPHKCQYCGKVSDCRAHLVIHERTHTGEKPHKCSACGKSFTRKESLIIHERFHTGEKPYKCSTCGKTFSDKIGRLIHERTHTGERPYICSECGKSFGTRCNLLRHRRVHTGEKPYKCLDCGQSFRHRPQLLIHEGTHTGKKPYQCFYCGKSFIQRSQLADHERSHTGEKPYVCSECGQSFRWKQGLQKHMRTHTGEKPYKCSECEKTFSSSSNLCRHQKIHTRDRQ